MNNVEWKVDDRELEELNQPISDEEFQENIEKQRQALRNNTGGEQ